jgi:hypothetical protein
MGVVALLSRYIGRFILIKKVNNAKISKFYLKSFKISYKMP